MSRKKKSVFKESFAKGLGDEMGKRTAIIIFTVLSALALLAWGLLSDDDNTSLPQETKIEKTGDKNGNVE